MMPALSLVILGSFFVTSAQVTSDTITLVTAYTDTINNKSFKFTPLTGIVDIANDPVKGLNILIAKTASTGRFTVITPFRYGQLDLDEYVVDLKDSSKLYLVGPFPSYYFNNSSSKVQLIYNSGDVQLADIFLTTTPTNGIGVPVIRPPAPSSVTIRLAPSVVTTRLAPSSVTVRLAA
jgi:hypothetical protein